MKPINELKVGDKQSNRGITTTVSDINDETGQVTWDVEYDANYLKIFKDITELFDTAVKEASKSSADPFMKDFVNDVRKLRNSLRTYLRNNKAEEYDKIKQMVEMTGTGGGAGAGSFSPGQGAQTAMPLNGGKKKYYYKLKESNPGSKLGPGPKAGSNGVKNNYYVKAFGYKPVDSKKLAAQSKAVDTKYLWKK